jgi:threonine synthase
VQISAFRFSPAGMQGVQTISYELAEQVPNGLDHVFCPAGGGGLTLAVAQGYELLVRKGLLPRSPAVHCVQPVGNNTIAGPLRNGAERALNVKCSTDIGGLQVPNVIDGDAVISACRKSGGAGHVIQDKDAFNAQRRLAREEGIFCEPAGGVALAGLLNAVAGAEIDTNARVACLVTGTAFKDTSSLDRLADPAACAEVDLQQLERWLLR